jgi:radical SAM superfamily enzyme YgiQ (UPF0313 family)
MKTITKMKKVAVVNSPLPDKQTESNQDDYLPPLGLGLIFSSIEQKYDTKFIDALAENLTIHDVNSLLCSIKPDFICINIFTTNYILVKEIVETLSGRVHWIIGGISTKSLYSEIFKWKTDNLIDIVYGDGERIVNDIIEYKVQEQPHIKTQNCQFYVVDIKSKYYVSDISNEILNRKIFSEPQTNYYNELEICIYVSRGCPYNCAFCVAAHSRNTELGGKIRRKNKNAIVNELNNITSLYPNVSSIRILDDLFLSKKEDFIDAAEIFNKFEFSWQAMCHIKSIANTTDESLIKIHQSGCKEIFVGVESGSPNILKRIHKTDNLSLIKESIKRVIKIGINVKGYFICGFPNETKDDLQKTLDLATALTEYNKFNNAKFRNSTFQFRPYYGTEFCDEITSQYKIPKENILNNIKISSVLNETVRNNSFNYDSGNYSSVSDDILIEYINKMNKLNE